MKLKRFWATLLAFVLLLSCSAISVGAAPASDNSLPILRVSGRLNQSIPAKSTVTMAEGFYLDTDDTIQYDCTYTPKSASVDFGVIAPDGLFYSLNCTSGSINKSIRVDDPGLYTLAIRNNASYSITVTGTVKY